MSKPIIRPNDFGNAGKYYDEKPRGNELFTTAPQRGYVGFSATVTKHDKDLLLRKLNILKEKGINYQTISREAGLHYVTVSRIIGGTYTYSREVFEKLTKHLGITDKMECLK